MLPKVAAVRLTMKINQGLKKLSEIDLEPFIWKNQGLSIQNYIKRQDKDYSIEGLIRLYFNIQDNFVICLI